VPSLVEHLDAPSLAGNTWMGPRRAACYPGDADGAAAQPVQGPVLPAACIVPHLAWEDGSAVCWLVDPDVTATWRVYPLRPVLRTVGLDEGVSRAIQASAERLLPAGLRQAVPAPLLEALAEVAMALGLASLRWTGALRSTAPLPVLPRLALRTMAPGGLRNHVGAATLTRYADEMEAFVLAVARTAASRCGRDGVEPLDCWDQRWLTDVTG
jgi:hypothetical protein